MDRYQKNFCQNIRHLRQVHLLTQKQMARILGISASTLGRMERCHSSVRLNCTLVFRVCDHFGISADALLRENWPEMLEAEREEG